MAIRAGQQEGIFSSEQAQRMRKNFAPHARFEHAENGDVHVRTHTRNGKTIAAHTRSAPQSTQAITPPSRAVKRCYLLTICQHKILQPISRIAPSL